jgi:hypothetical protein
VAYAITSQPHTAALCMTCYRILARKKLAYLHVHDRGLCGWPSLSFPLDEVDREENKLYFDIKLTFCFGTNMKTMQDKLNKSQRLESDPSHFASLFVIIHYALSFFFVLHTFPFNLHVATEEGQVRTIFRSSENSWIHFY